MVLNPTVYPSNFPSNDSESDSTALEKAVRKIQTDARRTALRQAHTRRISGQNAVRNQNSYFKAHASRLPLHKVGLVAQKIVALGSVAFFISGQDASPALPIALKCTSLDRLDLTNESITAASARISEERQWPAVTSNSRGFWAAGGWADSLESVSRSIDRFTFLKQTNFRIASRLSSARFMAVGCGNKFSGYFLGGMDRWTYNTQTGERLSYATETVTNLGEVLKTPRSSGMTTAGDRYAMYIFGGSSNSPAWGNWMPIYSIEKLNYNDETVIALGVSLGYAHVGHGAAGNSTKIIIAGGWNTVANWFINATTITTFTIAGETVSTAGYGLSAGRTALAGTGSDKAGYFGGGFNSEIAWPLASRIVDKVTYATDTLIQLGSQLARTRAELGAAADYGAGFSY